MAICDNCLLKGAWCMTLKMMVKLSWGKTFPDITEFCPMLLGALSTDKNREKIKSSH